MADSKLVKVTALGPIRHGDENGIVEYGEGDSITVTTLQAKALLASKSVTASAAVKKAVEDESGEIVEDPTNDQVAQPTEEQIAKTLEETQV